MNRFAALLDGLLFTPSRNGKLRLMRAYFAAAPDPERGWGLAALTGELAFDAAKPNQIRRLAAARVDPELFGWSYDFVGDLAETVALIWPAASDGAADVPTLSEIVEQLRRASRDEVGGLLSPWLDALDATGRWALLKLVTGSLRIGVSARLAKVALAEWGNVGVDRIEEVWHGLAPPYRPLFDWLEGRAPPPHTGELPTFWPLMLAQPLEDADLPALDPRDYLAEWKWDGIRVQLVARGGERRLYSRSGDEIGAAFPDVCAAMPDEATLDGELLVARDGAVASFNDLQQRLNRKSPSPKLLKEHPAAVRLYDILREGPEDLRGLAFAERRRRLESWHARATTAGPRPVAAGAVCELGGAARIARRRSRARRRGADAEARRFALSRRPAEGSVVQMETRRADPRHGADVRPARARQALVVLFGLYLRRLARRRAGPGRQGLFGLYRRGIAPARPLGAQQHGRALRAGPRGRSSHRARSRV